MPHLFPGASWKPMPGQETRTARRKGRGAIFHVAVYIGPSIYSINLGTGNDAHLYVRKDGTAEQNIDLDLVAYAAVDANPTMVMVETEGGKGTSGQLNAEPWTPQQAETLAQIAAYLHTTEGAPLQVMTDSLPSSSGIAVHRWGITPWRVAGGEKWSGVNGKECPGNAKIAQVPAIVTRAQQIAAGATVTGGFLMALNDDQQAQVYNWLHDMQGTLGSLNAYLNFGGDGDKVLRDVYNFSAQGRNAAVQSLTTLAGQPAAAAALSPEQLSSAIAAAIPDDLADAVAKKLGEKLAS